MYIAILGRQPELSMTELECLYGINNVTLVRQDVAQITSSSFDFNRLGGSQKAGSIVADFPKMPWANLSKKIIQYYTEKWRAIDHKVTLGISVYGANVSPKEIQRTGIFIKKALKASNISVRLVPNEASTLSTATSHHNKLGLSPNKVELLVVFTANNIIVAESIGAQNISAFAARDQQRPKRDAFVGMLPPKLARMMVNMSGLSPEHHPLILDPFCGTGVVLQEALVDGFTVAGSDLSEKMIDYTAENLAWICEKQHIEKNRIKTLEAGDAMTHTWKDTVDAVVCESYLGQPFSAPPSPAKLDQVRKNCQHIISSFLKNIAPQLPSGTPLVVAVPAWRSTSGTFSHLPLANDIQKYGFSIREISYKKPLLYYRENQVVARELLLLVKP